MSVKVSSTALILTLHGASQVILGFAPSKASRTGWMLQRFLDMQPSCNTSLEFDVATEEGHEKGMEGLSHILETECHYATRVAQ